MDVLTQTKHDKQPKQETRPKLANSTGSKPVSSTEQAIPQKFPSKKHCFDMTHRSGAGFLETSTTHTKQMNIWRP
jgi:hypothetical protein